MASKDEQGEQEQPGEHDQGEITGIGGKAGVEVHLPAREVEMTLHLAGHAGQVRSQALNTSHGALFSACTPVVKRDEQTLRCLETFRQEFSSRDSSRRRAVNFAVD